MIESKAAADLVRGKGGARAAGAIGKGRRRRDIIVVRALGSQTQRNQTKQHHNEDDDGRGIELSTSTFTQRPYQNAFLSPQLRLESLLLRLDERAIPADSTTYARLLQACGRLKALSQGKRVHAHIVRSGLERDVFLANNLVHMYSKCGRLEDARRLFDKMQQRNVVSCTTMIAAYAQHGLCEQALQLFRQMQLEGVKPNKITFITVLKACASLRALADGKIIHARIVESGFESDVVVENALVTMYGKCGSVEDARMTFEKMHQRNVVSWTAMIAAYAQHGYGKEALRLFQKMRLEGVKPNNITFLTLLSACANSSALAEGKMTHAFIVECGLESDVAVGNAIVNMYGKCGSLEDASEMFSKMHHRDVVSWNAMIAAYAQHGYAKEAFQLFCQMYLEGVKPNKITLGTVLNACASPEALAEGKVIHSRIADLGFESDIIVGNALVSMYSKCRSLQDAQKMFNKMRQRDVVSWTAMIGAYAQHGYCKEALQLFQQMQLDGVKPNNITFLTILDACASLGDLAEGKMIHAYITECGFESDVAVGNALVDMYGKCGSLKDARRTFNQMNERNVVSWTAMIAAYAQHGDGLEALQLYQQMQQEGMHPDKITFISAVSACASLAALAEGKMIHEHVADSGFESDVVVGNALVNMYGKCRSVEYARRVFDNMVQRDVASWNAMIAAYGQNGHGKEALQLFEQMQQEGEKPDKITFLAVLDACATLAALAEGKMIHACIIECKFESDVVVGNSLVNMYGRCGSVEDARKMFDKMHERNVVSWSAMIGAYAQYGDGMEAFQLFGQMQQEGVKPNSITFVSILSACSHAGLVDDGCHYFSSMKGDYGITPTASHYGCMIDLFGRAGRLDEAENIINSMPFQPGVVAWMTLLGACRNHGDVERGKRAAEHVLELDPQCGAAYIVLSNIYAAAGMWSEASKVRTVMVNRGVKKQPGRSSIEIKNRVHEFVLGDRSHPQTEEIYAELEWLCRQMERAGYVPDTKLVLQDVEEEKTAQLVRCHSEKLAIAFGLISTPHGTVLRIIKNLRVCSDCHDATKLISKIVGREIVVRDANRFHHFKDGMCSCRDYW